MSREPGLVESLVDIDRAREARDESELRRDEHVLIEANLILSVASVVAFVALAMWAGDGMADRADAVAAWVIEHLSWFFILLGAGSLAFLLYLAGSRFGNVVLGEPGETPRFDDLSWYSMMFSAGMGAGILYHGVAEPLSHFVHPPVGEPRTLAAARSALSFTNFHWGLNAWALYVLCAVGMAYFGYRKRKKYLISSAILDVVPGVGARRVAKVAVDLVATVAVVFGVAASLTTGTLQIAAGADWVWGVPDTATTRFLVLAVVTGLYTWSAVSGLERGMRWLSNLNVLMAVAFLLFVLGNGPTLFLLKVFVDSIGQYLADLPRLSFQIAPWTPEYEVWMGKWTLLLFTWWITWTPFVGLFIARISRGRTIRELVVVGLLAPTLFSMFWFAVMGGTALHLELYGGGGLAAVLERDISATLFALLARLPAPAVSGTLVLFLLVTFLVTSADSACLVVAMMTTEGDLEPKTSTKLLWALLLAAVSALLLAGGGRRAVAAAALTSALPFAIVLILIAVSTQARLAVEVRQDRI